MTHRSWDSKAQQRWRTYSCSQEIRARILFLRKHRATRYTGEPLSCSYSGKFDVARKHRRPSVGLTCGLGWVGLDR